jgi:uncharacterized cupin superfamily protein
VPRGSEISWQQTEVVRKIFMRFDEKDGSAAYGEPQAMRIDDDVGKALPGSYPPELLMTELPDVWEWRAVNSPTSLSAGLWAATSYARRSMPFACFELMIFLEGEIRLRSSDGESLLIGRAGNPSQ